MTFDNDLSHIENPGGLMHFIDVADLPDAVPYGAEEWQENIDDLNAARDIREQFGAVLTFDPAMPHKTLMVMLETPPGYHIPFAPECPATTFLIPVIVLPCEARAGISAKTVKRSGDPRKRNSARRPWREGVYIGVTVYLHPADVAWTHGMFVDKSDLVNVPPEKLAWNMCAWGLGADEKPGALIVSLFANLGAVQAGAYSPDAFTDAGKSLIELLRDAREKYGVAND